LPATVRRDLTTANGNGQLDLPALSEKKAGDYLVDTYGNTPIQRVPELRKANTRAND